jgi:hypothetical protein
MAEIFPYNAATEIEKLEPKIRGGLKQGQVDMATILDQVNGFPLPDRRRVFNEVVTADKADGHYSTIYMDTRNRLHQKRMDVVGEDLKREDKFNELVLGLNPNPSNLREAHRRDREFNSREIKANMDAVKSPDAITQEDQEAIQAFALRQLRKVRFREELPERVTLLDAFKVRAEARGQDWKKMLGLPPNADGSTEESAFLKYTSDLKAKAFGIPGASVEQVAQALVDKLPAAVRTALGIPASGRFDINDERMLDRVKNTLHFPDTWSAVDVLEALHMQVFMSAGMRKPA